MKFLVLAVCVCAASAASIFNPLSGAAQATANAAQEVAAAPVVAAKAAYDTLKEPADVIVRSESEINEDGFKYGYETKNGITGEATGTLKDVDKTKVVVVEGSYKYVDTEGNVKEVKYEADENGYRPQSDLLPVGPAIPVAIARSLEYIRTHYKPENQ